MRENGNERTKWFGDQEIRRGCRSIRTTQEEVELRGARTVADADGTSQLYTITI